MATELAPVKILTVGPALGSISELFSKIKTINAKHGPFDFSLCIGDFFAETTNDEEAMLLEGKLEVPLECYIMQGSSPLPSAVVEKFAQTGGELCRNVFMLTKSGVIQTAQGLRIACLGGIYDAETYHTSDSAPGFLSPFFSTQTVEKLRSNALTRIGVKGEKSYMSLSKIQSTSASDPLVDILISNVVPPAITRLSAVPMTPSISLDAYPVDDLVRQLRPKYHFSCAGGVFWEREPFAWEDETPRFSRFINVGSFGGPKGTGKKERWFYAFSINPGAAPAPPPNLTKNPFLHHESSHRKRPAAETENYIFGDVQQPGKRMKTGGVPPTGYKCKRCDSSEHFINDCPERTKPPEGYVCKICNTPGHLVRDCPERHATGDTGGKKPRPGYVCRACGSEAHYLEDCPAASGAGHGHRGRRDPPKEIMPDECWFCLSNPNLAKHLIVAIGTECYVTLPKGQLTPTQSSLAPGSNSHVPGGGHVLIIPIAHYPTFPAIPADLAPAILEEIARYKDALARMYKEYNAAAVFFEVGRQRTKGGHAHVQAVPVPNSLAHKVEGAFLEAAQRLGYHLSEDSDESQGSGYFKVQLPDGKKLVHIINDGAPFGLQFGREVLASLLGQPQRSDWKVCVLSEKEDKNDAQAFKTSFQPFDVSAG